MHDFALNSEVGIFRDSIYFSNDYSDVIDAAGDEVDFGFDDYIHSTIKELLNLNAGPNKVYSIQGQVKWTKQTVSYETNSQFHSPS